MALTLAEGLINALVTYVEANLPTKLDALDAEYPDTIVLEDTVATYKGIKSLGAVPNYPALFVVAPSQSIAPLAASGGAAVTARPEVVAGIIVIEQDVETLQVRLYRYGRALVELMLEAMAAGNQLGGWNLATDQEWEVDTYSDTLGLNTGSSECVGAVTLAMRANRIETK